MIAKERRKGGKGRKARNRRRRKRRRRRRRRRRCKGHHDIEELTRQVLFPPPHLIHPRPPLLVGVRRWAWREEVGVAYLISHPLCTFTNLLPRPARLSHAHHNPPMSDTHTYTHIHTHTHSHLSTRQSSPVHTPHHTTHTPPPHH